MPDSAYLSEHEAPRDEKPSEDQTPEQQAAVKLAEKLYREAKIHRSKYDHKWSEQYNFLLGKQWKQKRPSYRHSEVINFLYSEVQTVLALLTDGRPQVDYLPEDPTDFEFSQILSQVISAKWDKNNWSATVAENIFDSQAIGTAIGYVPWKTSKRDGVGDLDFCSQDPFYFFPAPGTKTKINGEECSYVVIAEPTYLDHIIRDYPEAKGRVKADLSDFQTAIDDSGYENIRLVSPVDKDMPVDGSTPSSVSAAKKTLLITVYIRSDEMTEEKLESVDETGQPKVEYQQKKKYPNGRRIVTANGFCLEDGPNPYGLKFPYGRLVDYIVPRNFWGMGEVEQMRSPQVIINTLISKILDVMDIMGNPIWIVDTTAMVDAENLTNQEGLVVEKMPGAEVRREAGVQLQPFVMQILDTFQERIWNKLASSKEVSQGVQPTENASGYQLELLQEAAQTKIRSKSRNLDVYLNEIGDLMADRILENMTVPEIIRITNNQNASQYFKFHVENREVVDEETGEVSTQKKGVVQPYNQVGENQFVPGQVKEIPIKGRFDVRVTTGSSLPFAKAVKSGKARELFKDGIFDAEDYLDAIEWPGKEKILQKYNQRMQAMAQQQTAQGGPPPPPPQGA